MQRHRHMHLARRYQVNRQMPPVQNREDAHEEAVRTRTLVGMHVQHDNLMFDGHGRGPFGPLLGTQRAGGARAKEARVPRRWADPLLVRRGGDDDGPASARVRHVLDPDGDARADDLLHREGVDDFRAVEGEFCGLGGRHRRQKAGGRYLARIGREDAVDFFPDLELRGLYADRDKSGAKICVSSADGVEKSARNIAKVSRDYGHAASNSTHRFCQLGGYRLIEDLVQALDAGSLDDVGQVHVLCVYTVILQSGCHQPAAQFLPLTHYHILGTRADLLKVLRGLEDFDQAITLRVDVTDERLQECL